VWETKLFIGLLRRLVYRKCPQALGRDHQRFVNATPHPPQDGTGGDDRLWGVAVHDDNSIAVVGYTDGDFGKVNAGRRDVVAIKLSETGEEIWRFQANARKLQLCHVLRIARRTVVAAQVDWGVFVASSCGTEADRCASRYPERVEC